MNRITKKLFINNLNNKSKVVFFNSKLGDIGQAKYSPSYSKEWINTAYFFNKNKLMNIPIINPIINKIIRGYLDLYLKITDYENPKFKYFSLKRKRAISRKRRNSLKKVFMSNVEIKHTNNKAMITLYVVDKEKDILEKKYLKTTKKINKNLYRKFFLIYKKNIFLIYNILKKYKTNYMYAASILNKKNYLQYKFRFLNKFFKLKDLYIRKIWIGFIKNYFSIHLDELKQYTSLYSLNRYKFDRSLLLPKLNNILYKLLDKKINYNIINLKSITYHSDIFTNVLALKIKKRKAKYAKNMLSVLTKAYLPKTNLIKERSLVELQQNSNNFQNKHKDLKIISHINNRSFDSLLSTIHSSAENNISKIIYDSIKYKNLGGIRLEVKGRLTKRYRADRSIYSLKWKGGLKNIDSSFKKIPSVLVRGNKNPNVSYSFFAAKRRIGAFAVKGWIGGK